MLLMLVSAAFQKVHTINEYDEIIINVVTLVPVVTTSLVNVVPTVRPEAVIDGVPAIAAGAIIGIVLVVVVVALIIVLFALL